MTLQSYMKGDIIVGSDFLVERRVLRRPFALRAVPLRLEAVFVAAFLRRDLRRAFLAVPFLADLRRLRVLFFAVRFFEVRFLEALLREPLRFAVLFFAAFLRVRFLAATMVLHSSSPLRGLWVGFGYFR